MSAISIERADRTEQLLHQAARCRRDQERQRLLDEVVVLNVGVAESVAARYRSRGIALDDLRQVACLGLVKAARRYDDSRGCDFLAFAVPTIRGEVKRYFRDHGWTVRPPRPLQDLQARVWTAENELTVALGRAPRPAEVAAVLGKPVEEVDEALRTDGCFTPASLDRPVGDRGNAVLGDLLAERDTSEGAAEARVVLAPVVRQLSARDRRILLLRFFHGWTQQEIATDLGVTQVQVSRLLARILNDLRTALDEAAPDA